MSEPEEQKPHRYGISVRGEHYTLYIISREKLSPARRKAIFEDYFTTYNRLRLAGTTGETTIFDDTRGD